ncbi:MAG: hypothetical protein IT372_00460 [Polyangiaceae bacterium]|nr:hypothetical protein [Polyangiaceae bacterium]
MLNLKAHALALAALLAPLSLAATAAAQSGEDFDKDPDDLLASDKQAKDEKQTGDKMPGEKDDAPPPEPPSDMWDTLEKEHESYKFVGLRFRNFIVPQFMVNLFADGGATVNVFSFGPEFTSRKDGLEMDLALSYADYSMDPFLFKSKDDDDDAWEIVSSSMGMILFTADFLYEIPLDKEKGRFSVLIGGGAGLGVTFGDLKRNQAKPKPTNDPNNLDTEDVDKWEPCATGDRGANPYCDTSNDHYGNYTESSWFNGGSKPSVFPYLAIPQISFRFKPMKHLQTRFDTGFSITGFFLGLSAGYGF